MHACLPLTIAAFKHARDVTFARTPFAGRLGDIGVTPMCDKPAMVSRDVNRDGCPITTVLLELAPADRAVAQAGRAAYGAIDHPDR